MRPSRPVVSLLVAGLLAGCGGSSGGSPAAQPSPTESPSPLALPPGTVNLLNPAVPLTKAYSTTVFRPAMSLRLPADWATAERDESAFQVYAGDEEHELTFDHTYQQKETVAGAMERLRKTPGLRPGPLTAVTVGGRAGQAFVSSSPDGSRFSDSGFHVPGGDIEVMVVSLADGTTLTVFVYSGPDKVRPLATTSKLGRRILATVTWR